MLVGEHVLKAYAMTNCVGVGNPCAPYAQTAKGTLTGCMSSGFEEVPFYVYEQPCANYYDACDLDNRYSGLFKTDVNSAYGTYAMLPNQDFSLKWHTNAVRQRMKIWSYDSGCNETLMFDTNCSHIGELILASANQTTNLDYPPFFAVNLSGEAGANGPYIPRNLYYVGTGVAPGVPNSSYANFPGQGYADGFDPVDWSVYQSRMPVSGSDSAIVSTGFLAPTDYIVIGECNVTGRVFPGDNVYFNRDFSITETTFNYQTFATAGSELKLNGNALINSQSLQLTSAQLNQDGSAFLSLPSSAIISFNTTFQFAMTNPGGAGDEDGPGADGLAFVLQTVSNSLGTAGGGLGYGGVQPSVAIEFDTFKNTGDDADGNHCGVNINGNLASVVAVHEPTRFNNGASWSVEIDYDGTYLKVFWWPSSSTKPATPQISYAINIAQIIGTNSRYAGFTAACGSGYQIHEITSWTYSEARRVTRFDDASVGLALNGNAYVYGEVANSFLRLTEAQEWQDGSAFITLPPSEIVGFDTSFSFQMLNAGGTGDADGPGADGLTFILQTVASNLGRGWRWSRLCRCFAERHD